jgi:hypothetical protein
MLASKRETVKKKNQKWVEIAELRRNDDFVV